MGLCYPGTFKMGYPEDYSNPETEIEIEHAFLLGATTVTQELYNAVMKTNPSYYKGGWGGLPADADMSKHPIENMSIYEAIEFCNKLSKLQGLDPFYTLKSYPDANKFPKRQEIGIVSNSKGYRLPEEKEWGYAAKAGTENRWAGTDDESKLEEYAWFGGNSFAIESSAQLVATKKPNEWGFYDMSGNV